MAIEELNLFVYEDNSDKILFRHTIVGGQEKESKFLDHSGMLIQLQKDEIYAGVFFDNPDKVECILYRDISDMVGVDMSGSSVVPLRPGEEIRVWNQWESKEIWLTHEGSSNQTKIPQEALPMEVS